MSDLAIKVENISKLYRIGLKEERKETLAAELAHWVKSPLKNYKKLRGLSKINIEEESDDILRALQDVSFEVKKGEVMGIIGKNGAGKSTLLKILSRVTQPSSGKINIYGRVASLLEVGTGFNPELTGRENTYLNGTILGMTKKEIDDKLDEIIDFSGIEKFLDTPVKRYSSGMKVRLAFSVAAHLDPEILIIDEVLAVGDAEFQKKCLGKMESVSHKEGRTVLFVSHNIPAVTRICSSAILLKNGQIVQRGSASNVVSYYLTSGSGTSTKKNWTDTAEAPGDKTVRLLSAEAEAGELADGELFDSRNDIHIKIKYQILEQCSNLMVKIDVFNEDSTLVFGSIDQNDEDLLQNRHPGTYESICHIPGNLLTEGSYFIKISIFTNQIPIIKHLREPDAIAFQIVDTMKGDSARGKLAHAIRGIIRPKLDWTTSKV